MFLFLCVGYLIGVALHGDLANHHTSSTLDVKTYGIMFISDQTSQSLAYTRHGYMGLVGLKSLVLKARVPLPRLGNLASNTLKF